MNAFIDDDLDEETESEQLAYSSQLLEAQLRKEAYQHIKTFFARKKYWAGGALPPGMIFSPKSMEIVLSTSVEVAVAISYHVVGREVPERCDPKVDSWEIHLVNGILEECASLNVPKTFAAGLLLLCLELCWGSAVLKVLDYFNRERERLLVEFPEYRVYSPELFDSIAIDIILDPKESVCVSEEEEAW